MSMNEPLMPRPHHPFSKTNIPTIGPLGIGETNKPTHSPSKIPTKTPSSNPSSFPSKIPTAVPSTSSDATIEPTANPSIAPTIEPTTEPISSPPTTAPTGFRKLHFICFYNDDQRYITTFLSLTKYAKIMVKVILSVIESQLGTINYNETIYDPLPSLTRGGIINFDICNVFDTPLLSVNSDCPEYDSLTEDGGYVAIGTFGIISDEKLNEYQTKITTILASDDFRNIFTKKMNVEIGNTSTNARRLLEYNYFAAIEIKVIDPLNYTSTRYDNLSAKPANNSDTTMIVIIVVICSVILMIIVGIAMVLQSKKRKMNKNFRQTSEGFEGNVEMEQPNKNGEGIQDALTQNPQFEQRPEIDELQNVMNGDEFVNQINEAHDEEEMDADIIASVNQTAVPLDKQVDEMDIIAAINETPIGEIMQTFERE